MNTPELTTREQEVLQLVVKGLNNPQIAKVLVISTATAKFHVSNLIEKFGVTTRTQVAVAGFYRVQH